LLVAIGLGNPGDRYQRSRHNLGKEAIIDLAGRLGIKLTPGEGDFYVGDEPSLKLSLVVPTTYMNLSGNSVLQAMDALGVVPRQLLVVCDDFNLPLGSIRLRRAGGDGGHKGLASVIYQLGTIDFPRLRLGIGPLPSDVEAEEFVLSDFAEEELEIVADVIRTAGEAILSVAADGIHKAMNAFNRRIDA